MARLDGYVADMEYVHHFSRELGPAWLNFVLAMQGIEPLQLASGFSCCDLGCGQGLSTNVFASCHPEGQFHSIDFNAAHIQGARGLAGQAKLENVTFWEASFDDLAKLDLPEFDFITLHGVYSWVSAENRKIIVDFIRCKLKSGGVVYVSYNCLPGWSPVAPIRQLLISCADMASDNLEEQIDASIVFVGRLKSMNLPYFSNNPSAGIFFDELSKRSRNYLAHEYFNEHWVPFYHADVVKELAPANLTFAGSASFADNLDFLRFSVEEQQLLNCIDDSILQETIKDFAVNQQFRKDVFTNGGKRLAQSAHLELVSRCRFALVVPREEVVLTVNFPRGEAHLDPELYKPVLSALEEQHNSLDELLLKQDVARFGSEKARQALMVLLSVGSIMPAVDPSPQALASTRLFNYTILERTALNMELQYLASPVVRGGIKLDWVQRLLLLCELTDSGDPLSFVSSMMRDHNHALIKDGAVLQSWDENLEELGRQIRSFHTCHLPLLKRLEVV
ncbi:MAG: methyltransferase domain-containing protein [Geobacteraceae bacterium]|nr:methyltransferase domain-containing protein [Geobacteraceae bacterium]NTW79401.1 methyltransferase domain-containing protein [Geobacteraceae bacterium]